MLNSTIEENYKIEKELIKEQNDNTNLKVKLETTDNFIAETQNKLFEANKNLSELKNKINLTKENYEKNQNENIDINDQLIKEVSQSNQICETNNKLNKSINEKNKKIDEFSRDNDILKNDIKISKEKINDYRILLENFKKNINSLSEQNEKINKKI